MKPITITDINNTATGIYLELGDTLTLLLDFDDEKNVVGWELLEHTEVEDQEGVDTDVIADGDMACFDAEFPQAVSAATRGELP